MTESKKTLEVLQWIEDDEHLKRPDLDLPLIGQDNINDRLLRKTRENIFVPLGLLATTVCLTLGLVNMKRGDSRRQQLFMRGRVFFQGFTLVAMTAGVAFTALKKNFSKEKPQGAKS